MARRPPCVFLIIRSRCEEACPVRIWMVTIRQHVIIFGRPLHIMPGESVHVVTRGRVQQEVFVTVILVHVRDHLVHVPVILVCLRVSKVVSEKNQKIICEIVLRSLVQYFHELFGFCLCILPLWILVMFVKT